MLEDLIRSGLARLDQHGIGLEADGDLHLVGESGAINSRLWGIGPIVRGSFWECTAVPDIRNEAQRLARRIAETLAGAST